jgi:WS/DGAT/MGAT family acyltransferase
MDSEPYERLSTQDSAFVMFERSHTHMHLAALALFDAAPLRARGGGPDIRRIRDYVASRLHRVPRYRQRLAYLPLQRHPAWVDDARFNLDYHVRHTSLPKPGGDQNLRDLVGRILSQQLDRDKPLWEMWIIEGLHGDRFAMLLKTHHCMVDGIAGQTLLSLLLEPSEETEFEPAAPWMPRPEPSALELLFCEGRRLTRAPLTALHALREALREPRQTTSRLTRDATAMLEVLNAGLRVVASTPLNRPIGTHRRIDWHSLDMRAVRAVKKRLDGTVNDVVLAVTAGAVRRYLGQRRSRIDELDYRVVIPVNMRSEPERTGRGNRISAWFLSLPIAEPDPIRRFGLQPDHLCRRAPRRQLALLQPDRHEHSRAAVPPPSARRAHARALPLPAARREPGARHRADELSGQDQLGPDRRLGSGRRPPRLRASDRRLVRGAARSRGDAPAVES